MSQQPIQPSLAPLLTEKRLFMDLVDLLTDPTRTVTPGDLPLAANPTLLQRAFYFAFARVLQQGPATHLQAASHPQRLIKLAQRMGQSARLPPETAAVLVHLATELKRGLRHDHFWSESSPLWWEPLCDIEPHASLWSAFASWGLRLGQLLTDRAPITQPVLLEFPAVGDSSFFKSLHRDLEDLYAEGRLDLMRGSVGDQDALSEHRGDEIRFLDGSEAELGPKSAKTRLLVRWLRLHVSLILKDGLNDTSLFPPQKAMLARYPAPSSGYAAHVDNPGDDQDNGRRLTIILYLNPPEHRPRGGKLTFWKVGSDTSGPPQKIITPACGTLVCFDATQWIHQVEAIEAGPPRWALSLWMNRQDTGVSLETPRSLTSSELFFNLEKPSLPPSRVICHHLEAKESPTCLRSYAKSHIQPRVGFVCTTYRGGPLLDQWCSYHFSLGAAHLFLVFDHLSDPLEAAEANRLSTRWGSARLTICDGEALAQANWPNVPKFPDRDALIKLGKQSGTSWSVAARQTLNASSLLVTLQRQVAANRMDWLVHLDADEFFQLNGEARGGNTLREHFALAQQEGWTKIRYANHELMPPWHLGEEAVFKVNPRLGQALLGERGWLALRDFLHMEQSQKRPYFNGYHNGKSAVAVQAAHAAAGVHDWYLKTNEPKQTPFFAGPSILHFHCPDADAFVAKYLSKVASPAPEGLRPFPLSPLEEAAREVLRKAGEGKNSSEQLAAQLKDLFHQRITFSEDERGLLASANLLKNFSFDTNQGRLP